MAVSHYMILENLQVKGVFIELFKVFLFLKPHVNSMSIVVRVLSRNTPCRSNKVIII